MDILAGRHDGIDILQDDKTGWMKKIGDQPVIKKRCR